MRISGHFGDSLLHIIAHESIPAAYKLRIRRFGVRVPTAAI
jgi:hypothetical protein